MSEENKTDLTEITPQLILPKSAEGIVVIGDSVNPDIEISVLTGETSKFTDSRTRSHAIKTLEYGLRYIVDSEIQNRIFRKCRDLNLIQDSVNRDSSIGFTKPIRFNDKYESIDPYVKKASEEPDKFRWIWNKEYLEAKYEIVIPKHDPFAWYRITDFSIKEEKDMFTYSISRQVEFTPPEGYNIGYVKIN